MTRELPSTTFGTPNHLECTFASLDRRSGGWLGLPRRGR